MTGPLISISDAFDSGNIELVSQTQETAEDGATKKLVVQLKIKPDAYTELEECHHRQYFCFRATVSELVVSEAISVEFIIVNASESSYPHAFQDYTVFYTAKMADTLSWRRNLTTTYDKDKGTLGWTTDHMRNGSLYFSYFPPFSYQQHLALVDACSGSSRVAKVFSLGQTLQKRDIDCIVCGRGPSVAWIIHRQHPGEPQGAYFAEGLLTRLLGLSSNGDVDGLVYRLLELYTFYIVPCMCPDGAVMGHLRTNAAGANLNREWATDKTKGYTAPTLERSPEVFHVLQKMRATGVDFFLDVHGDEDLPYNFLMGAEGTAHWGPRLQAMQSNFLDYYIAANSDLQAKYGYEPFAPGKVMTNIASVVVADEFDCLSLVLEMPYKECLSNPNPSLGWTPQRCRMMGASVLEALQQIHPYLRGDEWKSLPADRYIEPTEDFRSEDKD